MDFDIIIIIIAVVGSIISSVAKKRNDAKKRSVQPPQQHPEEPKENPWATIIKEITGIDDASEDEDDGYFSYDDAVEDVAAPATAPSYHNLMDEFNARKEADAVKHPENKITQNIIAQDDISRQAEQDNSSRKSILDDFNLRDAIVYSELLKPKFDE